MNVPADHLRGLAAVAQLVNDDRFDDAARELQRLTDEGDPIVERQAIAVMVLWDRIKARGRRGKAEPTTGLCRDCASWGSLDPGARLATCRAPITDLPLVAAGVLVEGGVLATGPEFGCVHWGAKE